MPDEGTFEPTPTPGGEQPPEPAPGRSRQEAGRLIARVLLVLGLLLMLYVVIVVGRALG